MKRNFFGLILKGLIGFLPKRFIWIFARRFIAGKDRHSALNTVKTLNKKGFSASVDYIGEDASDIQKIQAAELEYLSLLNDIILSGLDADIALKLSHFGLLNKCTSHSILGSGISAIINVIRNAEKGGIMVWIDAERLDTRDDSWFFAKFLAEGRNNIGMRIQAYASDAIRFLDEQTRKGWRGAVGVCKGAYHEPGYRLLTDASRLHNNFLALCELVVKNGCFLQIDTHDEQLINKARKVAGASPHECAMLLGVNYASAARLKRDGEKVRIYTPYGSDIKGYVARRIAERPQYIFLPLRRT